ncbi:hypothetical protein BDAP_001806 [Binucleata daphniae]
MRIVNHFGKCLIKRRFKLQKENNTDSVTMNTAIEAQIDRSEHVNPKNRRNVSNIDNEKIEKMMQLYNIEGRMPPRVLHSGLNKQEYKFLESKIFNDWKYGKEEYVFERNIEIWRQFWIAIERSDVIVQVIDCRCIDLFLVNEMFEEYKNKEHLLLLNKCDLLNIKPGEIKIGEIDNVECNNESSNDKFDASNKHSMQELNNTSISYIQDDEQQIYKKLRKYKNNAKMYFVNDQTPIKYILDTYKNKTFAFTGFPNVGKSSTINNLFKHKKVTVSKTPGKTKHLQSLFVGCNQVIDTPGIVFPLKDKFILLLYGVINIDTHDYKTIVKYIVEFIGLVSLLHHYKIKEFTNDSRNNENDNFMISFCKEHKMDYGKAVKIIVKDFMDGRICKIDDKKVEVNYEWYNEEKENKIEVTKNGNTYFVGTKR